MKSQRFPEIKDNFVVCQKHGTEIEPYWRYIAFDNFCRQKEIETKS